MQRIDMDNKDESLLEAIMKKTYIDGGRTKLTCASALLIARQSGVKPSEVGAMCNEHNIRISTCQLGCFE